MTTPGRARYRYALPAPVIVVADVWQEIAERLHSEDEMTEIRERFSDLRQYCDGDDVNIRRVPRSILGSLTRRQWSSLTPEAREALTALYLSRDVATLHRGHNLHRTAPHRPEGGEAA